MNDAQKLAIIDEIIRYTARPRPPTNAFNLDDFCKQFMETEGRPISVTAARRLLDAQVRAGLLETDLFQECEKRRRYWWMKDGAGRCER